MNHLSKKIYFCPYCNSLAPIIFKATDRNRNISQETFNYHLCKSCFLIFIHPIPENLGRFYPSSYYYIPSSINELANAAKFENYKIKLVNQFISEGRLLEIGPSIGSFSYLAQQNGFQVDTIEQDDSCCTFIQEKLKIPTIKTDNIISALPKTPTYNVIALWQVIEHLPEFWKTLEASIEALLPNGIIILAAPNPSSLQFRIFKKFWTHLDAPRHVSLIPISLIVKHLESKGLKLVLKTVSDQGCLSWNHFGWIYSLSNFCSNRFLKKGLIIIGKCLNKLFKPLEKRFNLGTSYTLIFKK
jgi:2-polyprenyl-3-methyl-5-hydroxy-6-metoxy-1,4-benzoquinol methylase